MLITIMKKSVAAALLASLSLMVVVMPAKAGMVGTAQIQHKISDLLDLQSVGEKRSWISEQLVAGGVEQNDAQLRVANMTDVQVAQIYQRIDQAPAGGNTVIAVLVVLVILDLVGVTDIFPFIRPVE